MIKTHEKACAELPHTIAIYLRLFPNMWLHVFIYTAPCFHVPLSLRNLIQLQSDSMTQTSLLETKICHPAGRTTHRLDESWSIESLVQTCHIFAKCSSAG